MQRILSIMMLILWGWAGPTWATDGVNLVVAAEAYVDNGLLRTPLTLTNATDLAVRDVIGAVNLAGLSAGIHILTVRLQDQDGNWSPGLKQSFYVPTTLSQGTHNRIVAAESFVDADPGPGAGVPVAVPEDGVFDQSFEQMRQSLTVTGFPFGVHKLSTRFRDANNNWSQPITQSFYLSPETLNLGSGSVTIAAADYSVNGAAFQPAPAYDGTFDSLAELVNIAVSPPATSYYWSRVRFKDSLGRVSFSGAIPTPGSITAPTAVTNLATSITAISAVLNAQVNDKGALTTAIFNFGTTTSYGSTFNATPSSINAGAGNTVVTATRTGLTCNTLYHYRVSAANSVGITYGADQSFSTLSCGTSSFTVTPSAGSGGNVSPNTPQVVNAGSTKAFTVTANSGYTRNSAVGGTCPQGSWNGNVWTTGAITANCTVSFSFTANPVTYLLTVTKGGAGVGIVTSVPAGINCGADCTEAYNAGTTVNLTATTTLGSAFNGWSLACTGVGDCAVNMTAAKSVLATFTATPTFTITPSAGAGGSISPATPQVVNQRDTKTFTVTPNAGYTASVGGTCGGSLSGTTYTTNPVTVDCTVAATFSSSGQCGDANNDGNVTIVDALAVARQVVGLPPPPAVNAAAADVNKDGKITIVDALLIARRVVGLVVTGTCFAP